MRAAILAALLLGMAAPAFSQAGPASDDRSAASADEAGDAESVILVVGDSGREIRLTADALRDAARAFDIYRTGLAPDAKLYLFVMGDTEGLRFALRQRRADRSGVRDSVLLDIDEEHRLALPLDLIRTGEWELSVRGGGSISRIRPLVLSPGSEIVDRRFGDLRLQCRVSMAFARLDPFTRLLAGAISPCDNRSVRLYGRMFQPVATASLSDPQRALEVGEDGMTVQMPLADRDVGNEARLRLTYR